MLLLVALVIVPDGSTIICVTYIISKTKMKWYWGGRAEPWESTLWLFWMGP